MQKKPIIPRFFIRTIFPFIIKKRAQFFYSSYPGAPHYSNQWCTRAMMSTRSVSTAEHWQPDSDHLLRRCTLPRSWAGHSGRDSGWTSTVSLQSSCCNMITQQTRTHSWLANLFSLFIYLFKCNNLSATKGNSSLQPDTILRSGDLGYHMSTGDLLQ